MMLQLNDDGVLEKVDEEKLITVNIDDLNEFINEKERLEQENKKLKELVIEVDNELEIRDIVCGAGKFRLEEWGKHRYHQFYKGDEELEDESVVIMLMELEKENKELKAEIRLIEKNHDNFYDKVFNLIDTKIEEMQGEMENDAQMESPSYYSGLEYGLETFKELKKELQDD